MVAVSSDFLIWFLFAFYHIWETFLWILISTEISFSLAGTWEKKVTPSWLHPTASRLFFFLLLPPPSVTHYCRTTIEILEKRPRMFAMSFASKHLRWGKQSDIWSVPCVHSLSYSVWRMGSSSPPSPTCGGSLGQIGTTLHWFSWRLKIYDSD